MNIYKARRKSSRPALATFGRREDLRKPPLSSKTHFSFLMSAGLIAQIQAKMTLPYLRRVSFPGVLTWHVVYRLGAFQAASTRRVPVYVYIKKIFIGVEWTLLKIPDRKRFVPDVL